MNHTPSARRPQATVRVEPLEGRLLFDLSPASDAFLVHEEVISFNNGVIQRGEVAMDADGEFAFAWEFYYSPKTPRDVPHYKPIMRMFARPGIGVGPNIEVHDRPATEAGPGPRIAATRDGDFLLAWQQQGDRALGRTYRGDGNPIGPSFPLTGDGGPIALAANPSGQFVVAWGNGDALYAQRFERGGGAAGAPIRLNRTVGAA